ncbi:MAG: glycoside hydrolase family 3 C-terminal domain-containing protein [Bifidobacteriaceae bacterium]|nr:glycoside hydrolase family 3 C-terminal domain-containing protein [Bifidobacteriaceae bacterium]MCI1914104.1 glycoside hydrolase family 3 C-terminal domain-containing protein [Bifidobacteriaceae bacterium]
MEKPIYLDANETVTNRVNDLVSRMNLAEKVGQLMQLEAQGDLKDIVVNKHVGSILHTSPSNLVEAANIVQTTRLKIPLLIGEDCIHGYSFWPGATIFPTQLAMAASWNRDLVEHVARVTAIEAAPTGIHWTFSPVLCIARDLRWGRVDETFGEDPYLIGELASSMVHGYQGKDLRDPTALLATAKHFAGYSETLGGRDASEADISQRKLRSWFLPPFEKVARQGCRTFMLGYESIDGVPITVNSWLLNDVLRGEWGYTGTLVTDWDNVGQLVRVQNLQPDFAHAAAAAVKAGNDLVMTTPEFFEGAQEAVKLGLIDESEIDASLARVLRLKFELGLFENPRTPDQERIKTDIGTPEHTHFNLQVARRSLVLLRNDGTLPLVKDTTAGAPEQDTQDARKINAPQDAKTIAVIGQLADDADSQLGDWAQGSGQATWIEKAPRDKVITVLDGLKQEVPATWNVLYAEGARILHLEKDPEGDTFSDGQPRPQIAVAEAPDDQLLDDARLAIGQADVSVVVVGDRIELVGEGRSTATLELFGAQIDLINQVAQTSREQNKPFVLVLMASKPLVLPASAYEASAIIWAGNPGMQGGKALAELMLGKIEPTGRLPISFPRHVGQQPVYYNMFTAQHGTRYADLTQEPAFAFGEGLSYSRVEYSDLKVSKVAASGGTYAPHKGSDEEKSEPLFGMEDTVSLEVTLRNTGSRSVLETVQLYVSDVVTSASWAGKELKGFTQVQVRPYSTATAKIQVPISEFTMVNASGERVVEPGDFDLRVGHSSKDADLLTARIRVE